MAGGATLGWIGRRDVILQPGVFVPFILFVCEWGLPSGFVSTTAEVGSQRTVDESSGAPPSRGAPCRMRVASSDACPSARFSLRCACCCRSRCRAKSTLCPAVSISQKGMLTSQTRYPSPFLKTLRPVVDLTNAVLISVSQKFCLCSPLKHCAQVHLSISHMLPRPRKGVLPTRAFSHRNSGIGALPQL